ncbi:MAG: dienelactone hydrolase family protein [Rhizobiaceae bacterium]|nr:dienelactone hydrolase family protein [Rhizobiaceae bacterium]
MPTFFIAPDQEGRFPAVILYMDGPGIREELRRMARRFSAAGFVVALPNLYYRDGGPSFDAWAAATGSLSAEMVRLGKDLTLARVASDTGALIAASRMRPDVSKLPMGVVGFCMGGRHALAAAATYPDEIGAVASLHGGRLVTDSAQSPHLLIPNIRATGYFGFGALDHLVPSSEVAAVLTMIQNSGADIQVEVHAGAEHGYMFEERPHYHREAAERSWQRCFALLGLLNKTAPS